MKIRVFTISMLLLGAICAGGVHFGAAIASNNGFGTARPSEPASAKDSDTTMDAALAVMKKRAAELKITGVGVVAYAEGDTIQSWSSKMVVMGRMKEAPSTGNTGFNLLGVAYAKSAEMADTLQNSGSITRPPMAGEVGWQGGAIAKAKTGYVIAAFSGGKSEEDFEVSKTGLEVLKGAL